MAGFEDMVIGTLPERFDMSDAFLEAVKAKFRWRRLKAAHGTTCVDLYSQTVDKKIRTCSIAVGNKKGEVLIYDNILDQFEKLEAEGSNKTPHARVLRWHREAPSTVKWSKDGKMSSHFGEADMLM
jgi:NET1-associated nuclear protein 1 (U3 small nucleolar RNA-associated protein 17)